MILKSLCILCGSKKCIKVHYVRKLSEGSKKKDYLSGMMRRMNKKQICIYQTCYNNIHKETYGGEKL